MKNIKYIGSLCLLVLLFSNAFGQAALSQEVIPGRIRIKFKPEAMAEQPNLRMKANFDKPLLGIAAVDQQSQQQKIHQLRRVFPYSPKHEAKHQKHGLHLWYELEFDTETSPETVVNAYASLAEIDIAKPVYQKVNLGEQAAVQRVFSAQATDSLMFNDPMLSQQWGYENDGTVGLEGYDIDLAKAWAKVSGSADIIVAIVDQGIDVHHEDLKQNIWVNEAELYGEEGVDDDGNGYIDDIYGVNFAFGGPVTAGDHGTHVAGVVGAMSNNGLGVAGVAGGNGEQSGVKMISSQVFDSRVNGGRNFAEAIVYGADQGAIISQNSWGYNVPNYFEPEVLEAINYFIEEAGQYEGSPMKGGIVIFAAGNNASEAVRYPGAFDQVLAVGALGPDGLPAPYTNYGDWVDLSAPGGNMSQYGNEGGILSTLARNKYGMMEGTSMACPQVSGVAALVVEAFGGEDFTADQLRRILEGSVKRFDFDHQDKFGKGALNAERALLDDNREPPSRITDLGAKDIFHNEATLTWTVPTDEDQVAPANFYLAMSDKAFSAAEFDQQVVYLIANNIDGGETFELQITGMLKESPYWFAVMSEDRFENRSEVSNVFTFTTSKRPNFMTNKTQLKFEIDVTEEAIKQETITFSNTGDGIIYWNASVTNETVNAITAQEQLSPKDSTASKASVVWVPKEQPQAVSVAVTNAGMPATRELAAGEAPIPTDHWKGDVTEFVAGVSLQNNTYPTYMAGTGDLSAGLIFATRFDIPWDYTFNLTHVEGLFFLDECPEPIVIEIKKGGRNDFLSAETVRLQEYYPDTFDTFQFYRMPLYEPLRIDENESFWVVLHFPSAMRYPLAMQTDPYPYLDEIRYSDNNGRSYKVITQLRTRPSVPVISALSTGDYGAFVFLDPTQGAIRNDQEQQVTATIDAHQLPNGPHIASMGIFTNDIHKPIQNIEVLLEISGQQAAIDPAFRFEETVFAHQENLVEIEVENTGLDKLTITGLTDREGNSLAIVKEPYDPEYIAPKSKGLLRFQYTAPDKGLYSEQLQIQALEGEFNINGQFMVIDNPTADIRFEVPQLTLNSGESGQLELQIENTSTADFKYDFSVYDDHQLRMGVMPRALTYTMTVEEDTASIDHWKAWKNYATHYTPDSVAFDFEIGIDFPFYDQVIRGVDINQQGKLVAFTNVEIKGLDLDGSWISITDVYHEALGMESRFLIEGEIYEGLENGIRVVGHVAFQVSLFADGTIKYHYVDIEDMQVVDGIGYSFGIRSLAWENFMNYTHEEYPLRNGSVVTFTPNEKVSVIRQLSSKNGVVAPGDVASLSVLVDPGRVNVWQGDYTDTLLVATNGIPDLQKVPFQVKVNGQADLKLPSTIIVEEVTTQVPALDFIEIENNGSSALWLTAVASTNEEVVALISEQVLENHIEILPHSKWVLPVEVDALEVGDFSAQIDLSFLVNGQPQTHTVTVGGTAKPDLTYTWAFGEANELELEGDGDFSIPFQLTNHSATDSLRFTISGALFGVVEPEASSADSSHFELKADGYRWFNSQEGNAFHRWVDISLTGEKLDFEPGESYEIDLPFSGKFFNQEYQKLWVSHTGFASFIEPDFANERFGFETGDDLRAMMAPFWSQIIPHESEGGLFLLQQEDRLILQWHNYVADPMAYGAEGVATFQLEILASGQIFFHYLDIEEWKGLICIGLESPDEQFVLADEKAIIVRYSEAKNNTSFAISPAYHGALPAGQTADFTLAGQGNRVFESGHAQDSLWMMTNSIRLKEAHLGYGFNYTGGPILNTLQEIELGEIFYYDPAKKRQQVVLNNTGHEELRITHLMMEGPDASKFYDEEGQPMVIFQGELVKSIAIAPGASTTIEVEMEQRTTGMLNAKLQVRGNVEAQEILMNGEVKMPPVMNWTATPQVFEVNSTESETYDFSISNEGEGQLDYQLKVLKLPEQPEESMPNVVEEVGQIALESPVAIYSQSYDHKSFADGYFRQLTEATPQIFAQQNFAPEGGLTITHIASQNTFVAVNEYVQIQIYFDGDTPDEGTLMYQQDYVIDQVIDEQWVYFALESPLLVPEGQSYYIIVRQPRGERGSPKYIGYDFAPDYDLLDHSFFGINTGNGEVVWNRHSDFEPYNNMKYYYKLRALSAGEPGHWLSPDPAVGQIEGGSQQQISATIKGNKGVSGRNSAVLWISTNDDHRASEFMAMEMRLNAAPVIEYRPNQYEDTLRMVETERKVFSYHWKDLEGDPVTAQVLPESIPESVEAIFEVTGKNTAQLEVLTEYESEGLYKFVTEFLDDKGNRTVDTLLLQVEHKNRPPVINPDYKYITMNLAGNSALSLKVSDLFEDPDGDPIQVFSGNYHPDIVEMSYGTEIIGLHALKEGTAVLVFAADDMKEDGIVFEFVYVEVINDPNAGNGELDGFERQREELEQSGQETLMFPNPARDQKVNLLLKLDSAGEVTVQFYDAAGRMMLRRQKHFAKGGVQSMQMDIYGLQTGLYRVRVVHHGKLLKSSALLVQ